MNLLVTGGAGFIGSHFVLRHIAAHPDDTVVVYDALTYAADKAFLAPVMEKIKFVQGDIAELNIVNSLIARHSIDTIVNFAAETHVDRSIKNPVPFLHSNILGVHSLIEVCRAHPPILLHHVSTDEVYGDQTDAEEPRTPDHVLRPSSPYAASKAAGDLLLMAAARTFGIRVRITRCTNNFGPHQASEKFIPTVIRSVLNNKKIPLYGKGKNKRDWLYVADHCDAIAFLLRKEGIDGQIINISADSEKENIEVATMILKLMGKSENLISFVPDRPGHDWRYAVDSSALRALGWQPKVGFEEGLKETIAWYQKMA